MALMKMLSALIFLSFGKSSVPTEWGRSLTVKRSVPGDWGTSTNKQISHSVPICTACHYEPHRR